MTTATNTDGRVNLPRGDVRPLTRETGQRLLASIELVRFAYLAPDGAPRACPDSAAQLPGGGIADEFSERGR